jgi:hypothetical protein
MAEACWLKGTAHGLVLGCPPVGVELAEADSASRGKGAPDGLQSALLLQEARWNTRTGARGREAGGAGRGYLLICAMVAV